MEQFPLLTAQQEKQWLFLSAAFSALDTDLEAEAGPGAPSPPPSQPFWPQDVVLSLPPAPLVPGHSPQGQKASPFVAMARLCKYNTE